MATMIVHETINANVADVWASWDEFGSIHEFNPNIQKSYLINNSRDSGLGAERRCDFADGKNHVLERITGYVPEERMEVDIVDGSMPMKSGRVIVEFKAVGPKRTQVTLTMHFVPKMGILGAMMIPMMKGMMKPMLTKLLTGNKKFVEDRLTVAA